MHFYQHERVAIFIDGANLHATVKATGIEIDYKKLLATFRSRAQLIRAYYYTVLADEQEYSSLRPLIDWLDYNGYTVVSKPAKDYSDSQGRRKLKGSMEVELAVDAMHMAPLLDHIVLVSGDGSFRCLVSTLQQMGKRVTVVSTLQTQPQMISDELRRQADQFIDIVDLEAFVGRTPSAQRAASAPASASGTTGRAKGSTN